MKIFSRLIFLIAAAAALTLPAAVWASGAAGAAPAVPAAPLPPLDIVNHQTRQCAQILPGDECASVELPPGWENLDGACPAGYATVHPSFPWVGFKDSFCCSVGHSGGPGSCQDVVLQPDRKQCAFVADIRACGSLPDGWVAYGRECPITDGYTWIDAPPACTPPAPGQPGLPTVPPGADPDSLGRSGLCASPLALAAVLAPAWAARRRRRPPHPQAS